jgi:spermidine/putrescine transport system substrate-binding protein
MTRRDFLRRVGGTAVALPTMAAVLEACTKPGTQSSGGQSGGAVANLLANPARPDHPVTLPLWEEPISPDTPIEQHATLKIYNWSYYIWPHLLREFEAKYTKYDVKVELNQFSSDITPAIQKITSGQVQADVFFPDPSELTRLSVGKYLKPLQHELIPNLAKNYWPEFQNPFYDQQWHYSVPYTIYTTGIAYRRDHIPDDEVQGRDNPYEVLWDSKWKGYTVFYDDYREAIGMSLLKNGFTDVNTADPNAITTAKEDLLKMVDATNAARHVNGIYVKMAHDVYWVGQSWSGDIIYAYIYEAPPGTPNSVWGYWTPKTGGMIGNDLMVIPKNGANPRLAHEFLNFMLEKTNSYTNFTQYNGYQTPMTSINPDEIVPKLYPPNLSQAVVRPDSFDTGHFLLELTPAANQLWNDAWQEITAGGG